VTVATHSSNLPVPRAISHETIAPFAPFAPFYGADVERTGLNVFAVSGCVLAVFVGGDHWVIPTLDVANLFYSTALAVIGSTIFGFKSASGFPRRNAYHLRCHFTPEI